MNRLAFVTVAATWAATACVDPPDLGEGSQAIVTANKVSLNKVSLNKVSLNKVSLNAVRVFGAVAGALGVEVPTASLGIPIDDTLDVATATPSGSGYVVTFDGASMTLDLSIEGVRDLVEKSSRCINPPSTSTTFQGTSYPGMFGIGKRGLVPEQFIESYMSCLAIFANSQSVSINVTADLPGTLADVRSTPTEFAVYKVPDVAVAYLVTATPLGATTRLTGRWYWNLSRHADWSTADARNLWGWQRSKGKHMTAETGRVCLDALRYRQPMPDVCGGDESVVWKGKITSQLVVPPDIGGTVLCTDRLTTLPYAPVRGTYDYNDYSKGVSCGPLGPTAEFSAVFYAELPEGASFVDANWQRVIDEVAPSQCPPGTTAVTTGMSGSGSGGGSAYYCQPVPPPPPPLMQSPGSGAPPPPSGGSGSGSGSGSGY